MNEFERIIGDSMMDESDREWAEMYGEETDPTGGLDDEWDDGWRWD